MRPAVRSLLSSWGFSLLGWGALSLALSWPMTRMVSMPWSDVLRIIGPVWLVWVLATPLIFRFVSWLPIERERWKVALPVHIGVCFATVLTFALLTFAVGPPRFRPPPPKGNSGAQTMVRSVLGWMIYGPHLPIYLALASAAHASYFYRRAQDRERRSLELAASLAQARLKALQMQIQPHFLFNSLNALGALVRKDPDAAEAMLAELGGFLRLTLVSFDEPEVPLRREREFVEHYLAIERVRFGKRLSYSIDFPSAIHAAFVPALLLQPLVENAVRHGIEPQRVGGFIQITARDGDGILTLVIRDNGPGLNPSPHAGVGLANTRARLRELHGEAATLELTEDSGVVVTVSLPLRFAT